MNKMANTDIPILQKLSEAYIAWHTSLRQIEKLSRYTLGVKIDTFFTETIELLLYATYASKEKKALAIEKSECKTGCS